MAPSRIPIRSPRPHHSQGVYASEPALAPPENFAESVTSFGKPDNSRCDGRPRIDQVQIGVALQVAGVKEFQESDLTTDQFHKTILRYKKFGNHYDAASNPRHFSCCLQRFFVSVECCGNSAVVRLPRLILDKAVFGK